MNQEYIKELSPKKKTFVQKLEKELENLKQQNESLKNTFRLN